MTNRVTNREILARRKRIEADLQKAQDRARAEARQVRAPAEVASRHAREALATGRKEIALGVLAVDIDGLTAALAQAEQREREAKAQGQANMAEVKGLEDKLKKCLCDDGHYEVYKIIAEKSTKDADTALQEANRAIAHAARLWAVAAQTWQPLREAVNTDDLRRRERLLPVPAFPLSQAGGAARPANVTVDEVTPRSLPAREEVAPA